MIDLRVLFEEYGTPLFDFVVDSWNMTVNDEGKEKTELTYFIKSVFVPGAVAFGPDLEETYEEFLMIEDDMLTLLEEDCGFVLNNNEDKGVEGFVFGVEDGKVDEPLPSIFAAYALLDVDVFKVLMKLKEEESENDEDDENDDDCEDCPDRFECALYEGNTLSIPEEYEVKIWLHNPEEYK